MRVYVAQDGGVPGVNVCQLFETNWPHIEWEPASEVWDIKVVIGAGGESSASVLKIDEADCNPLDFKRVVSVAVTEGEFFIPIDLGEERVKELMKKNRLGLLNIASLIKKCKKENPVVASDAERLAVINVGYKELQEAHPQLASLLRTRYQTRLQRRLPEWKPMKWQTSDDSINALYPKLLKDGKEVKEIVNKHASEFERLGITVGLNELDHVQLNLGLPFPGDAQRKAQGLKNPDSDLIYWMEQTAKKRIAGIASQYAVYGDDFLRKGVHTPSRVGNYQGAVTSSTSHLVRQAVWAPALKNEKGMLMYADHPIVTVSGFRNSANPGGKKRPSFVLAGDYTIQHTKVRDGEELKGEIFPFSRLGAFKYEYFTDQGIIGARPRIVANAQSEINDAMGPITAYSYTYKYPSLEQVYSQIIEVMESFVPGTIAWTNKNRELLVALRRHNYLHESFVKLDDEDILRLLLTPKFLERLICGDVLTFDGFATSVYLSPYFKTLLSADMFNLFVRCLRADKVGVYADAQGLPVYYYINSGEFKQSYRPDQKHMIERTAEYFDSLPSGNRLTSEAGKGGMSSASMLLGERSLKDLGFTNPREAINKMDWEIDPGLQNPVPLLTFMKNFMNNGGDDHQHATTILVLMTGKTAKECEQAVEKHIQEFEFLKILVEDAKMNCGHLYHTNEDGGIVGRSLSPKRFFTNVLYAEYPRGATGLYHSYRAYVDSAIGTQIEQQMLELGNLMITKILGFKSIEHLESIALLEEEYIRLNPDCVSPIEAIAAQLGLKQNDLTWQYGPDQLLELGVDERLLDQFKRNLPEPLTVNIFKFFNENTVKEVANLLVRK